MNDTPDRLLHRIPEAASRLGLGRSTLYELIAAGRLRARKLGARTVVLDTDLTDFLNSLPDAVEAGAIRATRSDA